MSDALPPPARARIVATIAWREARAMLAGMSIYVVLTIALVAAVWVLLIDVRALKAGGIVVLANPFGAPLMVAVLVLALYLALSAAVSVARDRESGVLEVLFYAPVDALCYSLGKIAGLLLAYILLLPLILAAFAALAFLTGFVLTKAVVVGLLLSVGSAAATIAFGVLLAIGTNRVRIAVLVLIGVTVLLIGVSLLYRVVLLLPVEDPASSVLPLRDALAALDGVMRWISPFAWLERTIDATLAGAWSAALRNLAATLAGAAGMVAVAALWLRRRGVLHKEG